MSARLIGPSTVVALSTTNRTWIQVMRCGEFVSQRYGKFSLTPADLKQMLVNFKTITPISPTQLPVDYDHLSMDPKSPGDGRAAGWIEDLELRHDGRELWARVEFTAAAAEAIRSKEYRFISPTFMKDYISKTGAKVGAALIAAAITNSPFLEGMAAVTLSAVQESRITMDVGQRVALKPEAVRDYAIDPALIDGTLVVAETHDTFARLEVDGQSLGWFHERDLEPARAEDAPAAPLMAATADLLAMAKNRQRTQPGLSLRAALTAVASESPAQLERYQAEVTDAAVTPQRRWQGAKQGHASRSLARLAKARADAKGIEYAAAVREVLESEPTLYAAWRAEQGTKFTTR